MNRAQNIKIIACKNCTCNHSLSTANNNRNTHDWLREAEDLSRTLNALYKYNRMKHVKVVRRMERRLVPTPKPTDMTTDDVIICQHKDE